MESVFSSPEFWQKLAAAGQDSRPITIEDQEVMLKGALDAFHEAGCDPLQVIGYLAGIAVFDKEAGEKLDWLKELANPMPGHWAGTAKERVLGNVMNPQNPLPTDLVGDYPSIVAGAQQKHPILSKVLGGLFEGDQNKTTSTMLNLGRGEFGDAASSVWGGLQSNKTIQNLTPYVLPGLAGVAAGRMAGMGWIPSLGLGAGAAFGGNYLNTKAQEAGGWEYLLNKWTPKSPAPAAGAPGATPAATPPPAPAPTSAAPPAQANMQANSANASRIQASTKPAGPAGAVNLGGVSIGNPGGTPMPPPPAVPSVPQVPGMQKNFNLQIGGFSPTQLGAMVGAVPGALVGGGIGALIPSTDEEGETHRLRNAGIGALAGGAVTAAGGAAAGHVGERVIKELAPVANPLPLGHSRSEAHRCSKRSRSPIGSRGSRHPLIPSAHV